LSGRSRRGREVERSLLALVDASGKLTREVERRGCAVHRARSPQHANDLGMHRRQRRLDRLLTVCVDAQPQRAAEKVLIKVSGDERYEQWAVVLNRRSSR
jgi:hypothetical protein